MENLSNKEKAYFIHPQYLVVYLVIAGVTALFLGFSGAYMYSRVQNNLDPIQLPYIFFVSAAVLFLTSYTFKASLQNYEEENAQKYLKSLRQTFWLTLIFFVIQLAGWYFLFSEGVDIRFSPLASYLYVISGVHIAHVLAGLPFLLFFYIRSRRRLDGDLSEMLYFSDVDSVRHLKLLKLYWLFLDRLWILLLIFFWLNWFIDLESVLG